MLHLEKNTSLFFFFKLQRNVVYLFSNIVVWYIWDYFSLGLVSSLFASAPLLEVHVLVCCHYLKFVLLSMGSYEVKEH